MTMTERCWRTAPSGEIIDQHGGMIAGDSRTRMASLMARQAGTDRWNHVQLAEGNSGQDCLFRQAQIEKAQAEYAMTFHGGRHENQ